MSQKIHLLYSRDIAVQRAHYLCAQNHAPSHHSVTYNDSESYHPHSAHSVSTDSSGVFRQELQDNHSQN